MTDDQPRSARAARWLRVLRLGVAEVSVLDPVAPEFIDDVPVDDELLLVSVEVPVPEDIVLEVVPAAAGAAVELVSVLVLEVPDVVVLGAVLDMPVLLELVPAALVSEPVPLALADPAGVLAAGLDVAGAVAFDGAPPPLVSAPPVPAWP